jgi:glycosidase
VLASVFSVFPAEAGTITLLHRDAVVWGRDQIIRGKVTPASPGSATMYVGGTALQFTVPLPGDSFAVNIRIGNGVSLIFARIDSAGIPGYSDTLRYTLGYASHEECYGYATVSGRNVTLHGSVVENPDSVPVRFQWTPDPANPSMVTLAGGGDSVVTFSLPPGTTPGEYFFNLLAWDPAGDSTKARTFVTSDSSGIRPFMIGTDHARWIDSAVIYGVTPSIFVPVGQFSDVTVKIPELSRLGVTALWIQPVYATYGGGQGYDVTDYFSIRQDVGGEGLLRGLVQTAHAWGLKVLFDFVPNHTSIYHPYAQDAISYGSVSHYFDFYQRAFDSAPYNDDYKLSSNGLMTFVDYFWADLKNLNYSNPEVQRMIIEAGKYWISRLGIDGYRVDAVWGVNARNLAFMQQWRLALKRIKPEALLIAEDKASLLPGDGWGRPSPFDSRFDAAYDWAAEESWVSHWVFSTSYSSSSNPTVFNIGDETQRVVALRKSLNNNGAGYDARAMIFRFLENNDTFRFLATHDLARTKMAASLLFALNGIPLIFNGQEIGAATHPYNTFSIFKTASTIQSLDAYGLFPYYQQLAAIRKKYPALTSPNMQEVTVSPSASVYAFRRWAGNQNVFALVNPRSLGYTATLSIPVGGLGLDSTRTYYLTDLQTGAFISGKPADLASAQIPLAALSTRMFILGDTVANVTSVQPGAVAQAPVTFMLSQNYPNPFNPSTMITFDIPERSLVALVVYDLLGREVATLVRGEMNAGHYETRFDGGGRATGVYFYRLESGGHSLVRKMLLMK